VPGIYTPFLVPGIYTPWHLYLRPAFLVPGFYT